MSNLTFQIGDRVLRADVRNPQHLQEGIVTRVTPNREGIDSLVVYVIDFGSDYAVLFENELLQRVTVCEIGLDRPESRRLHQSHRGSRNCQSDHRGREAWFLRFIGSISGGNVHHGAIHQLDEFADTFDRQSFVVAVHARSVLFG